MKYLLFIVTSLFVFLVACQTSNEVQTLTGEELVKKGEYLVMIGGCHDCHTPKKFTPEGPVFDMNLSLSGHPEGSQLPDPIPDTVGPGKWVLMNENLSAFIGPWGMSFTANLTPDEQTGIGLWKEENFINAMRTGKHMGLGRPILPPMPWFNLTNAKEEDLKAIFAYLKSIKPIKNLVPGPVPPDKLSEM
jgi:hypothetical protein